MVSPWLTLMSLENPWMLGSPAPLISHSVAGFPGLQFSATMLLAGAPHGFFTGCAPRLGRACAPSRVPELTSWKPTNARHATTTNSGESRELDFIVCFRSILVSVIGRVPIPCPALSHCQYVANCHRDASPW